MNKSRKLWIGILIILSFVILLLIAKLVVKTKTRPIYIDKKCNAIVIDSKTKEFVDVTNVTISGALSPVVLKSNKRGVLEEPILTIDYLPFSTDTDVYSLPPVTFSDFLSTGSLIGYLDYFCDINTPNPFGEYNSGCHEFIHSELQLGLVMIADNLNLDRFNISIPGKEGITYREIEIIGPANTLEEAMTIYYDLLGYSYN